MDESLTPETDALIEDMLHGAGIPRCDEWDRLLANAKKFERQHSLAQTEIKGHMRIEDDLQARIAELEKFLHSRCIHPDYEYGTTTGPRKAWYEHHTPEGEGWEKNVDEGRNGWDRFDYHEEAYWRRKKPVAIDAALKDRA